MMVFRTLVILVAVIASGKAMACSCESESIGSKISQNSTIISAMVIEHLEGDKVLLNITEVWKGGVMPKTKEAIFAVGLTPMCTHQKLMIPDIGAEYILSFTYPVIPEDPLYFRLGGCSANTLSNDKDLELLRAYRKTLNEFDLILDSKKRNIQKARFLFKHRTYVKARDAYEKVILDYPNDLDVLSEFSELLLIMGEKTRLYGSPEQRALLKEEKRQYFRRALEYANKALSIDDFHGNANVTRSRALVMLSKKK